MIVNLATLDRLIETYIPEFWNTKEPFEINYLKSQLVVSTQWFTTTELLGKKLKFLKRNQTIPKLFHESWFINKEFNISNRNDGVTFPSTYKKVFKLL